MVAPGHLNRRKICCEFNFNRAALVQKSDMTRQSVEALPHVSRRKVALAELPKESAYVRYC
jgi:hypothetical protein